MEVKSNVNMILKQDLNPKFIDCSGYSLSGKSAVLELFQEFEGYFAPGREVDFELLRIAGGLRDLENAVVNRWNPVACSIALSRFSEIITKLGSSPSLYNLIGQYNSYATKYDDRFHGKFTEISKKYIKDISNFSGTFQVNTPYFFRTKLEYFTRRLLIKFNYKNLHRGEKLTFPVQADEFYRLTRNYLDELFDVHNQFDNPTKISPSIMKYKKYDSFILSNACETSNPSASLNLFNNCKQIVVDRDPRDIFLFTKMTDPFSGKGHIGHLGENDIDLFIKRFRAIRERSEPFNGSNRILIYFEDLILNYEESLSNILDFIEENPSIHIHKKRFFNPEKSINHVGIWKNNSFQKEVAYIEKKLPEFCRDY